MEVKNSRGKSCKRWNENIGGEKEKKLQEKEKIARNGKKCWKNEKWRGMKKWRERGNKW